MYFPKAEELTQRATEAEKAGENEKASELYLYVLAQQEGSYAYKTIAAPPQFIELPDFPLPDRRSRKKHGPKVKRSFTKANRKTLRGSDKKRTSDILSRLREHPIREVKIPHTHKGAGDGDEVPVNYLVPPGASASNPAPLVLIITGLDGYRTELAVWQYGWLTKGVATLIAEIPGTGDSPAARQDPTSPDRQWSSVLDWLDQQKEVDHKRIIVWGFSTGGYYALRVAHTHKDRLLGSVSLGGGAHHMFDREWLENVNKLEYPFDLANTLTYKFGYPDLESFIKEAPKFSLLNDGTLDKPCAQMLLVNGNDDEIFPIDDMFVSLEHGVPKQARMVKGKKHMGEPDSFFIILKWIYAQFGLSGDIMDQMKLLPSRAKY